MGIKIPICCKGMWFPDRHRTQTVNPNVQGNVEEEEETGNKTGSSEGEQIRIKHWPGGTITQLPGPRQ